MSVLQTQGISVQFRGLRALDGVGLSLSQGEVLGLLGPNGAGKTTLIDVMTGYVRPSEGRMLLGGEETVAVATQPGAGVLVCDESRADDVSSSACSALAICGPVYVQPPDAAEALRFALGRFRAGKFDDPETLDANYLSRSDAEGLRAARAGA